MESLIPNINSQFMYIVKSFQVLSTDRRLTSQDRLGSLPEPRTNMDIEKICSFLNAGTTLMKFDTVKVEILNNLLGTTPQGLKV